MLTLRAHPPLRSSVFVLKKKKIIEAFRKYGLPVKVPDSSFLQFHVKNKNKTKMLYFSLFWRRLTVLVPKLASHSWIHCACVKDTDVYVDPLLEGLCMCTKDNAKEAVSLLFPKENMASLKLEAKKVHENRGAIATVFCVAKHA